MNFSHFNTAELLAAYNKLSGENVKRFTDRKTAEKRIAALLEKRGLDEHAIGPINTKDSEFLASEAQSKRDQFMVRNQSAGLARLRANSDAEALRQQTLADQAAAFQRARSAGTPKAAGTVAKPKASTAAKADAKPKKELPKSEPSARRARADYGAILVMLKKGTTHEAVKDFTGWPRGLNRMKKIAEKAGLKLEKRGETYIAR